jgi:hypothetical protein
MCHIGNVYSEAEVVSINISTVRNIVWKGMAIYFKLSSSDDVSVTYCSGKSEFA